MKEREMKINFAAGKMTILMTAKIWWNVSSVKKDERHATQKSKNRNKIPVSDWCQNNACKN